MLMECRVPQSSTPDACDIYSSEIPDDTTGWPTTTTPTTTTIDITTTTTTINTRSFTSTTASTTSPTTTKIMTTTKTTTSISINATTTTTSTTSTSTETTQLMKLSGSITTAYAFSDDLKDPESDTFIEYATTVESEMTSIMMQSSMMKSVNLQVTGFQPVSASRKRRQAASDTRAMAEFEAIAEVPESASMNDVQGALEAEIQSASDDGFDSLDSYSFSTIGVLAEAITTTSASTKTTTSPTTATSTIGPTSSLMTTTPSPELASLFTCSGGNDWFKIDQSKSVSWSWQASISIGRRASAGLFSCSGVILASDWILTAADCCIGSIVGEMEVYTGSLDYSHGTMHKVQFFKVEHQVCAIKLEDKIYIDGRSTSVGCFDDGSSLRNGNCWMASWPHKVMTHHRQNRLSSKSVEITNHGTIGYAVCNMNSNQIDFTGSPVMCQMDSVSYISGVVWEDKGCQPYTREVLLYDSSLITNWIGQIIEDDKNNPPAHHENSEVSPNEVLETVQSVFNFLGGVFNFLAEREKNSHD